jgi:Divergent InlB B-repeat domain
MRTTRIVAAALLATAGVLASHSGALASGGTPAPAAVTAPALSTVTLKPTDVVGGTPAVGTVTLTSAAATGGFTVALSSDDTVAATVPAAVTVPAGATSATFPVTTVPVGNTQSALIIGTAGPMTSYGIITVYTQSAFSTGSIAIIPGGNGNGAITSQPAGINCTVGTNGGSGTCSASYPAGTLVRLTAKAAPGSKFQGWRGLPGCGDPSKITVARNTTINCQPGFTLQ